MTMNAMKEDKLCFPHFNASCRKALRPPEEHLLIYILVSLMSLLTLTLNLFVIISISHFRQLHTTTNLLLLSLAVSDFFVGFVQLPINLFMFQGCWFLGDFMCAAITFVGFLINCVAVGTMVLISIDRYVAICEPMYYSTKVTLKTVQVCVCLCWMLSGFHSSWMLRDFLKQPSRYNTCYGECTVVINDVEGAFDLAVSFAGPIAVIIVLYMRVFVVAVSQARAVRSHAAAVTLQPSGIVRKCKRSETKAARNLGIVVAAFLLCFCPYYSFSVAGALNLVSASTAAPQIFLLYFNSCLNPIIYAFFYPWFRKSVKLIVTLRILQPDCREAKLL